MKTKFEGPEKLDEEIDRVTTLLGEEEIGSEGYEKKINALSKLWKIKAEEKPDRISKDTMLVVATNLLSILLIIRHEHVNVITSKAFNMVPKARV